MCDLLLRIDQSTNGIDVPKRCFIALKDNEILKQLEKQSSSRQKWEVFREKCPYCDVDIFLGDFSPYKCSNGHNYARCALTLRACKLRTYRVCIGCERKVSCKNSSAQLDVESILLNIDTCPFCGCRLIQHQKWWPMNPCTFNHLLLAVKEIAYFKALI